MPLPQIPLPLLSLFIFLAITSILMLCFIMLESLFRKRLTPEQLREKEASLAEADAISRLTAKRKLSGFDRWFATLLEEADTGITPLTASMMVAGFTLLVGGAIFVITDNILLGVGSGMISMVIPMAYWMSRREWRISRMRKYLPEALEAIGDSLRSGLNLEMSMENVAQQLEEPLKAEFEYGVKQLAVGLSPTLVMERMARRIPVSEFRIFTTAVLVHRKTGGNLALLAERLAKSARDRTEFNSLVKAVSAGSRLSMIGLVVVTLIAMLFLAGMNGEYLRMFLIHPYGPRLIGLAVCLILVGSLWAWKIMKITY